MSPLTSPCRNACSLDSARRMCRTCGRTIEEIVAWPQLDEAGKRAVWARLEAAGKPAPGALKKGAGEG